MLQDLWIASFGAPDLLVTDGGPEFGGEIETVAALFGMVHEVVPEGAKWRMGLAERHGAIVKLRMMRIHEDGSGNATHGAGGSATGLLGSLCSQEPHGEQRRGLPDAGRDREERDDPGFLDPADLRRSDAVPVQPGHGDNEALQWADRIRQGAIESYHWLDSQGLTSRSRPPTLEGVREGATVYMFDPPMSHRGQARRLQDNSSWSGHGVIVCRKGVGAVPGTGQGFPAGEDPPGQLG